jgi:hypothetical protein
MLDMAGFPGMPSKGALIAEKIFDSAADSFAFSGLDGNTDGWYELEIEKSDTISSTLYLHVNGNVTLANYWRQQLGAASATPSAGRVNDSAFMWNDVGKISWASVTCARLPNGVFAYRSVDSRHMGSTAPEHVVNSGGGTFTIPNITSITISAGGTAGGIGVGTKIRLLKGKR